jgi:anti-sigma-K factor RskA
LDIKNYIESGIIECYVLGAVSAEEKAELEQLAEQYPEIKQEIEANKFALAEYVLQYRCEPPAELRDKVIQKLDELYEDEENFAQAIRPSEPRVIVMPARQQTWVYPSLVAAALILLLISIGFDYLFYRDWQEAESRLQNLASENEKLNKQFREMQSNYQTALAEVNILANLATKTIQLKGLPNYTNALVTLYWNTQSKDVYLIVRNLPTPPPGMQYQLWSIEGSKVEDAGLLAYENKQWQIMKMKTVQKAQVFAITLEKTGGESSPKGAMFVKGEA